MKESSASVSRFRVAARRALGLHLDDAHDDFLFAALERRAQQRRVTPAAYLDLLEDGAAWRDEPHALANELTVGETYFFRHAEQLRAFSEVALVDRAHVRGSARNVRILCAGCASGEEAYSLAILTHEAGLDTGPGSIRAVDASPAALAKAARATYSAWALRETPAEWRARWFEGAHGEHVVPPLIRAMVRFDLANLAADTIEDLGSRGAYDIVFCRNVLMYFAPDRARAAVARLTALLAPGGYLFLGHAETLRGLSNEYHLRHTHGAFYYQRRTESGHPVDDASPSAVPASWVDSIRDASERVKRITELAPPEPDVLPDRPSLPRALELARVERFDDALEALGPSDREDIDALLLRAALLTQNGSLLDAERACRGVLAVDDAHAGAHYLLALVRDAIGDREGAVDHDRMAAHLDPSFAMPRLHLGLLMRRSGDLAAARSELGQALELLQREEPARVLLFGGGFGRDGLIALCRGELRACGARA